MTAIDISFNANTLRLSIPTLLRGLGNTIPLGITAIALATLAGLCIAMLRLYAPHALQGLVIAPTDLIRATPVLMVLILIHVRLSPFAAAALSIIKDTSLASVNAMSHPRKQTTEAQALIASPTPRISAALLSAAMVWPRVRLKDWREHRFRRGCFC